MDKERASRQALHYPQGKMGILYESRGGQTAKIAKRMAETVKELVGEVRVSDIKDLPSGFELGEFDAVILGAPIYYSRHTGGMNAFIRNHRDILLQLPSFFFSVSLNANDDSKSRGDVERCVTKFLAGAGWTPRATTTLAGAVLYRDYNWIIRLLMKFIVARHGGQTDTSRNYEYTNWNLVEKFARECAGSLADQP